MLIKIIIVFKYYRNEVFIEIENENNKSPNTIYFKEDIYIIQYSKTGPLILKTEYLK